LPGGGSALAQEAASSGGEGANDSGEILVTATRRETSLQKTSESIQVLTGAALAARGAMDFNSYFLSVPNLSQSENRGPGNTRYSLRGISSAGEPLVGIYYDEVPLVGSPGESLDPGGSQPDLKLWDVERVEVLKGPQGTLFGNGSAGGTIRIISAKPDLNDIHAAFQGSVGTVHRGSEDYSAAGMINLPIVNDKLAVRATAYYDRRGGFIDEAYLNVKDSDKVDVKGGRAALSWQPGVNTKVTLTGWYQKTEAGAASELFDGYSTPAAARLIRTPYNDRVAIGNLSVEQDLGFANLLYSGSYQNRRVERNVDGTRLVVYSIAGIPLSACPESALADRSCIALVNGGPFGTVAPLDSYGLERNKAWTHEVRLTSAASGPFQWTLGYYFEKRDTSRQGAVAATDIDGVLGFAADGSPLGAIYARDNWGKRRQQSVYGEASYAFTNTLTLTGGARWFNIKRSEDQTIVMPLGGVGATGPQPTQRYKKSDSVYRAKLAWQATDDVLLYALASQGFRVGGPNQPVGFDASAPSFNDDKLWNYEAGWKTRFFDHRLTLNGAVFLIDWKNIQFLTTDPTGAFTLIGNAGDARVKGFELELQAEPIPGLTFSGGVGYSDARFHGAQPVQALADNQTVAGRRLPNVPRWTTTLFAQYKVPVSDTLRGFVNGDWAYRSDQTTGYDPSRPNFRLLGGYHVVTLRTGVENDRWSLMIEAKNLFDVMPEISGRVVPSEPFQYATIRPRTIAATMNVHF
jgi:outer membrane receptor protein involved in Fe transport